MRLRPTPASFAPVASRGGIDARVTSPCGNRNNNRNNNANLQQAGD